MRYLTTLLFCCFLPIAMAANHEINLDIGYKIVNFTGSAKQAITANQQIPAPTLHFKEGDHVTINVHNHLDEETALHWHGILVPWQMDGVKGVNQKGIAPGESFRYEFTLWNCPYKTIPLARLLLLDKLPWRKHSEALVWS